MAHRHPQPRRRRRRPRHQPPRPRQPPHRSSLPLTLPQPLLDIQGLHVEYGPPSRPIPALRGVTLQVQPGEVVAIVGESGSGKSTTAHAVIKLLAGGGRITQGRITFAGEDITHASRRRIAQLRGSAIGLIPQDPGVALNPIQRVGNQVAEVLRLHNQATRRGAMLQAIDILARVGIRDPALRARQYPHELSGGMRQRVLIGIALACRPQLVIADEATSALDVTVQRQVLDQLALLTAETGAAVLLITHDLGIAADRAARVVVMQHGTIVEQGRAPTILTRPTHAYTKALLAAVPGRAATARPTPTTQPTPLLIVKELVKQFQLGPNQVLKAVDRVSFTIPRGQTFALVGESGSGKSTTARIIARLETPSAGSITFDGTDLTTLDGPALRTLRRRFQLVYQNPYSSLDPRMTVQDIIAEPLRAFAIGTPATRRTRAAALLDQVALPAATLHRRPGALSGGQRQRVAIARALALQPDLLILDEPVSALDVSVQEQILRLLEQLQRDACLTYLMISHDLAVVRQISDQVGVMRTGQLLESGPCETVFNHPVHPYTQELLSAIPGRTA